MGQMQRGVKDFEFNGGITSDGVATNRLIHDMENLIPGPGGQGLRSRTGLSPVVQLTSAETSGCRVFLVSLDDVTGPQLVATFNCETRETIDLGDYKDNVGRAEQPVYSGGFDIDDPNAIDDATYDGSFAFASATYSGAAGGNIVLTVSRTGDAYFPVTVTYATSNGTAIAGTDYTDNDSTLSFASGDTSKTITIATIDAGAFVDLTCTCTITAVSAGSIGAQAATTITITPTFPSYAVIQKDFNLNVDFYNGTTVASKTLSGITGTQLDYRSFRAGRDKFIIISYNNDNGTTSDIKANFFRLSDINSGTLTPHTVVSVATILNTQREWMRGTAYNSQYFFLVTGTALYKIDMTTPGATTVALSASQGVCAEPDQNYHAYVDSEGYIVCPFGSSPVTLARIDPANGNVASTLNMSSGRYDKNFLLPLPGGGIISQRFDAGTGAWMSIICITANLGGVSTITTTSTLRADVGSFAAINADGKYVDGDAFGGGPTGLRIITATSLAYTAGAANGLDIGGNVCGVLGWKDSSTFFQQFLNSGGQDVLREFTSANVLTTTDNTTETNDDVLIADAWWYGPRFLFGNRL